VLKESTEKDAWEHAVKIGTIVRNGAERVAVFSDGAAVDLVEAFGFLGVSTSAAKTALELIAEGDKANDAIGHAVASGLGRIPLDEARLGAPVPNPGKVVCLALNNTANKDRILSGPDHPALFLKPASCLIGSGEAIVLRPEYGRVHAEPELALVVGRKGRNIPPERACDYIYGYTILNDLTSPTMRAEDTFHYRAIHPGEAADSVRHVESWVSYSGRYKGSDTFGPLGPWIVTRDEIADPHDLVVRCLHQGSIVTEDSSGNLFHKIPDVIAFISRFMTLHPGDIVSLGTAMKNAESGGRAVQAIDLNRLGGPIAVSISGIGTLENPVVRES
jgi:2-keto-4-pentenoate hydratase/2-oxohepta-3-ene-1,7-dioic acid hydratase in catechol pathway